MLLLDAYNVLHCSHVLPDRYAMVDPAGLCAMIRRSGMGRRGARIVCDGVAKPHEHPDTGDDDVQLIYAGPGRDADPLLEQLIDDSTAPREMVVVSNDRRIRRAARRRRATALGSERFLHRLADRLRRNNQPPPADEKPDSPETQAWLKKFGLDDPAAYEQPQPEQDDSDVRHWLRVFGFED